MFKRHHYLSGNLPMGCRFYVGLVGGELVAFAAVAPQMGRVGYRRFSRVVVLPDYQGIGVGGRFRDAVAQTEQSTPGVRRLSLVTSHPAMIRSLANSPRWRCCQAGMATDGLAHKARQSRMTVSFVYNHRDALVARRSSDGRNDKA